MARDRRENKQGAQPVNHAAPTKENITLLDDASDNVYSAAVNEGHGMDPRARKIFIICVVLVAVYFFGLIVPSDLINEGLHYSGTSRGYSLSWFVEDLLENVNGLIGVFTGHDDGVVSFASTMIRYIIIAMTGAGLALTGAIYQGTFKNALVSPSTLGVSSGASLGMMLWIVFFVNEDASNVSWYEGYANTSLDPLEYLVNTYSLSLISFVGCILVVTIVVATMRIGSKGSTSPIMMIITGQVLGSIIGAVTNSIRYYYLTVDTYGPKADLLTDLMIASFYRNYTWIDVVAVGIPLLATFLLIMRLRNKIDIISLSKEEARSLGVDTGKMQIAIIGLCTLLTAILISFCGSVGFVGFLVPHMARRLVGPSFSYLLPAATALGAVFVLGAYVLLTMTLGPSYETMVGMFISIFGSGVFLITALRGKGGVRGEFK